MDEIKLFLFGVYKWNFYICIRFIIVMNTILENREYEAIRTAIKT